MQPTHTNRYITPTNQRGPTDFDDTDYSRRYVEPYAKNYLEPSGGPTGEGTPPAEPLFKLKAQTSLIPEIAGNPTPAFSRASAATVVDHEGVVRTALAEEARFQGARRTENRRLDSENFGGGSSWVASGTSGITTFNIADKDGGTTAVRFEKTGTGDIGLQGNNANIAAVPNVLSVYARVEAGTGKLSLAADLLAPETVTIPNDGLWHRVSTAAPEVQFNIISINIPADASGGVIGDIVDICFVMHEETENTAPSEYCNSATAHGANALAVQYYPTENNSTVDGNGVVTEDYSTPIPDSTLLGYVSERASTNEVLWSEDFTQTVWRIGGRGLIGTTNNPSPDGSNTAGRLECETNDSASFLLEQTLPAFAEGTAISLSAYVKADEFTWVYLTYIGEGFSVNRAWFNLSTGTVGTVENLDANHVHITALQDGWYRIGMSVTTSAAGLPFQLGLSDGDNNPTFVGTAGEGVFTWGWQAEATDTTAPSSYIKTEAATANRGADWLRYATEGNWDDFVGSTQVEGYSFWKAIGATHTLFHAQNAVLFMDDLGGPPQDRSIKSYDGVSPVVVTNTGTKYSAQPVVLKAQYNATTNNRTITYGEETNTGTMNALGWGNGTTSTHFGIGNRSNNNSNSWGGTVRLIEIYGGDDEEPPPAGLTIGETSFAGTGWTDNLDGSWTVIDQGNTDAEDLRLYIAGGENGQAVQITFDVTGKGGGNGLIDGDSAFSAFTIDSGTTSISADGTYTINATLDNVGATTGLVIKGAGAANTDYTISNATIALL